MEAKKSHKSLQKPTAVEGWRVAVMKPNIPPTYIYSAYYDGRFETATIRVIGLHRRHLEVEGIWCTFSHPSLTSVKGTFESPGLYSNKKFEN